MLSSAIRRSIALLAAAGFIAVLTTASNAWSQETVYIGGPAPRGTVQVDMSVLDDLGRGGQAAAPAGQHVTLTPPRQKKPAAKHKSTTKAKSVATRKAPASTKAAPTAIAKADAPAPVPAASTPAAQPSAPQAKTASSDLPSPPPEPNQITLPAPAPLPAAPKAVAAVAATTAVASATVTASDAPAPTTDTALPRDVKPAPSPAPSTVRLPDRAPTAEPDPMSASAAVVPAAAIAAEPASASPAPKATTTHEPDPAAQPTPAPQAAPTQTAALAPATQTSSVTGKSSVRIPFSGEATTLPEPSKADLTEIASSLSKDPALRVQVMAYAKGSDDASKARRLSLSRALSVRSYLIEQGVGSTRIDVRALGNAAEGGPADRVDLMVLSR